MNTTGFDQKELMTFNRANWETGHTVLDALAQHDWELVAMNHARPGLATMKGDDASWSAGNTEALRGQYWVDVREFDQLPEFAAVLNGGGSTMGWYINEDCTLLKMRVGSESSEYRDFAYFRVTREQVEHLAERVGLDLDEKIDAAITEREAHASRRW